MTLTKSEEKVLGLLPRGEGRRQIPDIAKLTGLNTRAVYNIIEALREKGVPIVSARKGGDTGLYIATTDEEKREGLQAYTHQLEKMSRNKRAIERSDVTKWQALLTDEEYNVLEEESNVDHYIEIDGAEYRLSLEVKEGRAILHADKDVILALLKKNSDKNKSHVAKGD